MATYTGYGDTITLTTTPSMWALPVRLSGFFTQPLGKKFNFTANAGVEYYTTAQFKGIERWVLVTGAPTDWYQRSVSGHKDGFGLVGALGMEYNLFRKVAFFIEAQGRLARFKGGFNGETVENSGSGYAYTETGKLYYVEDTLWLFSKPANSSHGPFSGARSDN